MKILKIDESFKLYEKCVNSKKYVKSVEHKIACKTQAIPKILGINFLIILFLRISGRIWKYYEFDKFQKMRSLTRELLQEILCNYIFFKFSFHYLVIYNFAGIK